MPAHQAQDALAADGDPPMRQARPDLAVAFAMKRRRREHGSDRLDDLGIPERRLWSALRSDDRPDGPRRHRRVEEAAAMKGAVSPGTGHRYPLTMICAVLRVPRSTVL